MHKAQQRMVITLVAALQFVVLLDFLMVLPLGPDLAQGLGFGLDQLGWITAAYTLASACSGLLALRWLDRFERKRVLLLAFGMVVLATVAASFCASLSGLLLARVLTGLCGGPALAVAMAMVIDATAPEQRGAAIAKVMLGFSVAVIIGVPLVLELARLLDWRAVFQAVSLLAALVWLALWRFMPLLRQHIQVRAYVSIRTLLAQAAVRRACGWQFLAQFSAFLLIPHFSAFFMHQLGLPRAQLGSYYAIGGVCALIMVQVLGRLADRTGATPPVMLASLCFCFGLLPLLGWTGAPLILFFVLFMAGNAGRNVSLGAVLSQIPAAHERAGFMSLQNVVQDASMALAALLAALHDDGSGKLPGMAWLATLALGSSLLLAGWVVWCSTMRGKICSQVPGHRADMQAGSD